MTDMPENRNFKIGQNVRLHRTARGMSLAALGKAVSPQKSGQQMALYESNQSRWPADLLCEVSKILAVDVYELLGMENTFKERKNSPDWKAEKYKIKLLSLKIKARSVVYRIIDCVAELDN